MIDLAEGLRFIALLTGNPDTPIVWQTADDLQRQGHLPRKHLRCVLVGSLRQHHALLSRLNEAGAAIWMQINAGARRGIRNITELRSLHIDQDNPLSLIPFPLKPSIIIQTSSGLKCHAYWLLKPLEALERFTPAQKHLIAYLQSDKSIHNLDRVMRLPGSTHMKDPNAPKRVRIVAADETRQLRSIDEILRFFPVTEAALTEIKTAPVDTEVLTPVAVAMAERIGRWLTEHDWPYRRASKLVFKVERCPFNPTHKDLLIRVMPRGGVFCGCFHSTCQGNANMWLRFKEALGDWLDGESALIRGDHVELARRLITKLNEHNDEPVVHTDGSFYRYESKTGTWDVITDDTIRREVSNFAGLTIGKKNVCKLRNSDLTGVQLTAAMMLAQPLFFADKDAAPGFAFKDGHALVTSMGIAFTAHSPDHRVRASVDAYYQSSPGNMNGKWEDRAPRFHKFLSESFAHDPDGQSKINLLQEFVGAAITGIAPRFQRCMLMLGDGDNGKALALNTPIPTPSGWTTQGALQVNDTVFDEQGKPCRVVALSPIWKDRPCFEITFSDGEKVNADAEHEWCVYDTNGRKKTKTTREIAATVVHRVRTGPRGYICKEHNWAVPTTRPLMCNEIQPTIDPYTLGVWLGNGAAAAAEITCHSDDQPHIQQRIEAAGYYLSPRAINTKTTAKSWCAGLLLTPTGGQGRKQDSIQARLHALNLINNKHIPASYLRASYDQRLALTQGLMDTDGSTLRTQAQCEYCSTDKALAHDVVELLFTLGLRPTIKESRATLYGKDCGPKWRVIFTTPQNFPIFSSPRKNAHVQPRKTPLTRKIIACTPISSVPTRCIQVDAPSHLYLCTHAMIPTHNSSFLDTIAALTKARVSVAPQSFSSDYHRATLPGAVLNIVRELPAKDLLSTDNFKAIISGEEIGARDPAKRPFTFAPVAGHLFACNELPGTNDHTGGFWRRMLIVEWTRKIAEHEKDRTLAATIIHNELSGVARWAIDGADRLLRQGAYTQLISGEALTSEWKADADVVHRFLEEVCERTPHDLTPARHVYAVFKIWLNENGHRLMSAETLGKRMKQLQVRTHRTGAMRFYGVRVTNAPTTYTYLTN